ncbi:D-amino-acid oxidase [Penicillium verrucosum]|uniref:D-amino-acid oxidase n=1 Tax=Penicillium verrucosum TaxID=60171 RepID=UPI00254541C1|nr:D-amino-acid oxidase [Penicillium verrucosum]KAJ5942267.1 D-amino-acid oxidase [Penicillium verrucosum]
MPSCTSKNTRVGIIGSGVIGLTSALLLVDAGYDVIIVARNLPGDETTEWASPWAGALLAPHPDTGFNELQEYSIKKYFELADHGPRSGIRKLNITEFYDDRADDSTIWYKSILPDFTPIQSTDMPPGATIGFTYSGLTVDPRMFLPWIAQKLVDRGVKFVRGKVESFQEMQNLSQASIVVNASGLGARELASDDSSISIRGQTMFVRKQDDDDFNRAVILQGSQYTYVIPRASGGVILGGVSQPGNFAVDPDMALRTDILERVNSMTKGDFGWVDTDRDVSRDIVGFRPARKGEFGSREKEISFMLMELVVWVMFTPGEWQIRFLVWLKITIKRIYKNISV